MSEEKYFDIDLPKWPELRVEGVTVTRKQAAEVMYRTVGSIDRSTNQSNVGLVLTCKLMGDRRWADMVQDMPDDVVRSWTELEEVDGALRKIEDRSKVYENYDRLTARELEIGVIQGLEYMVNHRFVSMYIGGPHGWMDWDGTVGTSGYNIGKWPSVQEVKTELDVIAAAFPFLQMRVQLMPGETSENTDDTRPLLQVQVGDGAAVFEDPGDAIESTHDDGAMFVRLIERLADPYREVGFTESDLALVMQCIDEHVKRNA